MKCHVQMMMKKLEIHYLQAVMPVCLGHGKH